MQRITLSNLVTYFIIQGYNFFWGGEKEKKTYTPDKLNIRGGRGHF